MPYTVVELHHLDADPEFDFLSDADTDPTFHPDANPDPSF